MEFSRLLVAVVMSMGVLTQTRDVSVSFAYNLMMKNRIRGYSRRG